MDFLPLKSYANITEGNVLRMDWESIVPKHELNYIMGNGSVLFGLTQLSEKHKNAGFHNGWLQNPAFSV